MTYINAFKNQEDIRLGLKTNQTNYLGEKKAPEGKTLNLRLRTSRL